MDNELNYLKYVMDVTDRVKNRLIKRRLEKKLRKVEGIINII